VNLQPIVRSLMEKNISSAVKRVLGTIGEREENNVAKTRHGIYGKLKNNEKDAL